MTAAESEEAISMLLERQAQFEHPYGLWAIVEQSSGLVAGMGLIKPRPGVGEQPVEVGWHLNRNFWGKGYATEMACGLITAHFEHSDADEVTTIILPDNLRSQATAVRLGFVHSGEWFLHPVGLNHRSYRLKREDW